MLKIRNITKFYSKEKVLDNCNFEIARGTISALIGLNGSGKTTIFNLINGSIHPEYGKIFLDSYNITCFSETKIANLGVSRLFQYPRLFQNLTVKENLLLATNDDDMKFFRNILGLNKTTPKHERSIKTILKAFNISHLEHCLTSELSFGQKRLVELARTILKPHKILLLDEPTYGIHFKIKNVISKVLKELKKQGDTIFLIEHDKNFISNIADCILTVESGRVIKR